MNSLWRTAAGRISAVALAMLMGFEGYRAMPYQDIAGVWTDGYGNTENVVPGRPVTQAQAAAKLNDHVDKFGTAIMGALTIPPTQGQFDSYLLLTYNIGIGGFRSSTLRTRHNQGDFFGACMAGLRWDKITDPKTKKKVQSKGLNNRRWGEYHLCLQGIPPSAINWTAPRGRTIKE